MFLENVISGVSVNQRNTRTANVETSLSYEYRQCNITHTHTCIVKCARFENCEKPFRHPARTARFYVSHIIISRIIQLAVASAFRPPKRKSGDAFASFEWGVRCVAFRGNSVQTVLAYIPRMRNTYNVMFMPA